LVNSIFALQKNPEGQRFISIQLEETGMDFILTFSDNGPGIDKNNRANIFVPFFTTHESGSGIGLSVIKQIMWKHKAEIYLSNEENGARFIIRFPKLFH
jgi:signal transduction histidine kinase